MAEALVTIGLAANIIQFVCFSFTLVSKTKELHESASGTLNENVELSVISQDIKTFSKAISSNINSSVQLSDMAERCEAIAGELQGAITKLQHKQHAPGSGKSRTRWRSFRKALKCVWDKPHIDELKARLERLRDQVTIHLVADTRDQQIQLLDLLDDWKKTNIQVTHGITAQIQNLDVQLQATQKGVSNLHGDVFWRRLDECFSQLALKVHEMSRSHVIVASLHYECMQMRQSAIRDAHEETFAWIYSDDNPETSDSQPYSGFAQWLQRGCGIYWVTGKPGSGKSTLMKYVYEHDRTIENLRVWCKDEPLVRACFYFWKPGQQIQKSMEGLLQSLLYRILHACPELAPIICPERWNSTYLSQHQSIFSSIPWTLHELKRSFALFRIQTTVTTKFYFQVDGLDEYHGDNWDLIETLQDLSTPPNVKLCLSSRPWNCFEDSFGEANPYMLRLHEFTRPDIELFARDHLLSHGRYLDFEPFIFEGFVRDIGARAQGVFLWVRLVVRSLRNGIINKDPISILQERLQAIPSDLEEFFEQILATVEEVYRSRMAWTFLVAMKSPQQLKLIHYYFLGQEDVLLGLGTPMEIWPNSKLRQCAVQTERILNGRYRGLLEATSSVHISAHTRVDFLHRTLSDFLATKRMGEKLENWASDELNVFTAISRALIAESKFIEEYTPPSDYKVIVELASKGAVETGSRAHCFDIIDEAELPVNPRLGPHSRCGLNCDMLQFAASAGRADYLKYRLNKDGSALNLDCILKHAIELPVHIQEATDFCIPSFSSLNVNSRHTKDRSLPASSNSDVLAPLPSLLAVLFELGADPDAIVDGASSWITLADKIIELMDSVHTEQCFAVLELFLEQGVDVETVTENWIGILDRKDADVKDGPRHTLRYLRCLFARGLDPNAATQGTTLTKEFLRTVARDSPHLFPETQKAQHELLIEFIRYGADISWIYNDSSPLGWFETVCRQFSHPQLAWADALPPRIEQYRILLEHGLDLNLAHGSRTIWESLLGVMHCYVLQGAINECINNFLHDLFLISLHHGASPHVPLVQELLKDSLEVLSKEAIANMETAIQRALNKRARPTQSRYRPQLRHHASYKIGLAKPQGVPPTIRLTEKRDFRQFTQDPPDRHDKRTRF